MAHMVFPPNTRDHILNTIVHSRECCKAETLTWDVTPSVSKLQIDRIVSLLDQRMHPVEDSVFVS
jgi:hypothetical protein